MKSIFFEMIAKLCKSECKTKSLGNMLSSFAILARYICIFLCICPLFEGPLYADTSSNPGAVNKETGTGELGEFLGISKESGVRLGGLWIPDENYLFCGGVKPHRWGGNNLVQVMLSIDTEKALAWPGGFFAVEFLQFNGSNVNAEAGVVQNYNSLPGPPPLARSELYQLWYRQELFDKKLIIRIGKSIPSKDFNNVLNPVPIAEQSHSIPSTSGVIYTPIFVNSSMLGVLPGYYNSAYGITITVLPVDSVYGSYGAYDGNLARGKQTGLRGPQFNQYTFQIGEIGCSWMIGEERKPGHLGAGGWYQTGRLTPPSLGGIPVPPTAPHENGTGGLYVYGSQRLWYQHPNVDNSGINGFFQWGTNYSRTLQCQNYVGGGVTIFGLVPCRLNDSFGFGTAIARLNKFLFDARLEAIYQFYYQVYISDNMYFESAISYIPTPGEAKHLSDACAGTARIIAQF